MITPLLVIFLLLVFVLLYLFLKTVDKRKWLAALLSLVLTPVVYFYMFYPFVNIISNYHHQKYFNSTTWEEEPSLRYEMIDNIIETDTLIGQNKNTVSSLLGIYEWLTWDATKKDHNSNKWNYGLGIEPGAFNDEKDCIEVIFEADKVKAVRHYSEIINYDNEKE